MFTSIVINVKYAITFKFYFLTDISERTSIVPTGDQAEASPTSIPIVESKDLKWSN